MIRNAKRPATLRAPDGRTPLRPSWPGTATLLLGLLSTGVMFYGESPAETARSASIGCGLSLILFGIIEIKRSWGNVLRADLVSMAALFYLVFVEFLFPQPNFDMLARNVDYDLGIEVVLWSFAAMAVGRHLVNHRSKQWRLADKQLPTKSILVLFWVCFGMGYFHMLVSVGFDPFRMIWHFMGPRFSEPWGRGQFGDAQALLYELGATIYLVPPLAGIILGRQRLYARPSVALVFLALLLTLFYGFTSGTRSVMGAFLITFMVAHYYAGPRSGKQLIRVGTAAAAMLVATTVYSIEFREVGLREYLRRGGELPNQPTQDFFVDYNLLSISSLVTVFPDQVPYLGWEVPEWFFVRVVPRSLWPGKPDGSAISPNSYIEASPQTTLSATFIGEAYMGGGLLGSLVAGLLLGWLATYWTKKAFSIRSDFGILLYGSGFFAVVITMRSMYMLPVASLPVLAVAVLGSLAQEKRPARRAVLTRAPLRR